MLFPYFIGLLIGTQIGISIERLNSAHAHHIDIEKITKLEKKITEYEHFIKNQR